MTSQFQNIFENVCRCFGHTPSSVVVAGGTNGNVGDGSGNTTSYSTNSVQQQQQQQQQQQIEHVNSTTSAGARRRTNRLELKDKQWDELFEKNQQGSQQQRQQQRQSSTTNTNNRGPPPRPEGYTSSSCAVDNETAEALAKVKLAANPPRYRTKRKRSAQAREEIFRTKDDRNPVRGSAGGRNGGGGGGGGTTSSSRGGGGGGNNNAKSSSYYTPQTDFSRLLNPSLALCFATPVRGTEEEPDETDMKSVDNNSDTATLNTNGEDTITSTLYFDSKYAHIPETRPPMPLFNQFKIGQAKDEIRTIMATDSHSSLRMIKLMQQQQQQQMTRDEIMETRPEAGDSSSSEEDNNDDDDDYAAAAAVVVDGSSGRRSHRTTNNNNKSNNSQRKGGSKGGSRNGGSKNNKKKDGIVHHDEEMHDAVPDVKAVSSSTDSSRLSNAATKQHTV
ncbi:hypothetical protein IV203_030706 [Nitzschia inconspicua]|uniref:Uncharacterized protein n=1 Tax=Nitzschia inconspicua TaxID=303405 RepID=A0A9K3Q1W9_9STRA|nr:hypothetical protein IV203_030706 [Nitzschia inconspicua]